MKTKRTVIAACIATLFISGTVFAKDTWEYHESGWSNVNSYGKVVVAQDSVNQWGPWEDFVEPAAGAPSPVAMPGMSGGDQYRNNPVVVLTEGCAAGDWCGYAIFRNSTKGGTEPQSYSLSYSSHSKPWTAGLLSLTLTPDDPAITAGSGRGEGNVFWRLSSLGATIPTFSDSGTNMPADFGGGYWWYRDDGLHHFDASTGIETVSGWDSSSATGFSHNWFSNEAKNEVGHGPFTLAVKGADDQVAIGTFERKVTTYTSGSEDRYWDETSAKTYGYYVAGIATPQAYLADQQTSNVCAYYAGGSFDGSNQGAVSIRVQFGPGTWQGQWVGSMNFKAEGNINGANIASSSVSALSSRDSASYAGSVQGTFYGQQAGSIGGVSSITKTYTPSVEARIAQMPSAQTQTAVFLVNKVYSSGSVKPE